MTELWNAVVGAAPAGVPTGRTPHERSFVPRAPSGSMTPDAVPTTGGIIAAPGLVTIMASGLAADPQAMSAAIFMTRLMFPYILLISIGVES